jgi:hypothetical protein
MKTGRLPASEIPSHEIIFCRTVIITIVICILFNTIIYILSVINHIIVFLYIGQCEKIVLC